MLMSDIINSVIFLDSEKQLKRTWNTHTHTIKAVMEEVRYV